MPEPTIRPATVDDVDFICQVIYLTDPNTDSDADPDPEWLAVAQGYTTDQVHGKEPDSITYVVENNGSRVGRLRVVRTAERHFIGGIQIHPAHQNLGIGTAVIDELVREARAAGRPLELNVNKQNPNAERLYTRLGFRRRAEDQPGVVGGLMTIR
jgi:ribosomal protein S18 acetylase RimI-like enzyme